MPRKKLSEGAVKGILAMVAEGRHDDEIGRYYGCSLSLVSEIRRGVRYQEVTGIQYESGGGYPRGRPLYRYEIEKAFRLARDGLTVAEIVRVIQRDAKAGGRVPPGYDGIARHIRLARQRGELPPSGSRVGRPPGSRPLTRHTSWWIQQQIRRAAMQMRRARMKSAEMRAVMRGILDDFERQQPDGGELPEVDRVDTVTVNGRECMYVIFKDQSTRRG